MVSGLNPVIVRKGLLASLINKMMQKKFLYILFDLTLFLLVVFILTPSFAKAQNDCPANQVCLTNPLGRLGINEPIGVVKNVIIGFSSIMGVTAIAFTVFNGFKLVIATTEEGIKAARSGITWSVGGFILSLLAFTVISGVAGFLGFPGSPGVSNTLVNPIVLPGETPTEVARTGGSDYVAVLRYIMLNFLGLVGFVTTGMIIYYGYRYLTSAGNEEAITAAKTGLRWSITGLIIILLAYTIITSVRTYFFQPPT